MNERRKNNEDRRSDVRTALAHYQALAEEAAKRRLATLDDIRDQLRNYKLVPDEVSGLLCTISGALVYRHEPMLALLDDAADKAADIAEAWNEAHADEWARDMAEERACDERREMA